MRKYLLGISLIVIFLVIFLPSVSTNPDGLEKVAETFGVEEQAPIWKGFLSDYSIGVGNPYVSTLLAGVFGALLVLLASLILGKSVEKKGNAVSEKKV